MKKIITFFIITVIWLGTANSQTQQIKVTWGPEQKAATGKKNKQQSYFIAEDNNGGYFSLREKYQYIYGQIRGIKRYIEHFDRNGIRLGSQKFKLKREWFDEWFDGIYYNKGKMYLVTYYLRKSDKMNVLSVQDIDPTTMHISEYKRPIAVVPYEAGLFKTINSFHMRMVDEKIYVLHVAPEEKNDQTLVSIHVFDKDFNLQWKSFHSLEYREKLFEPEDFDIDHNGTVRLMASIYKDKKRKVRQGKPNYEYHFFVFANKGDDFKEHTISLGDKFITDMKFSYRPNGDIACVGFYSDGRSIFNPKNTITGAFYVTVDPESTNIKIENYKAFDEEFLSNFMSASAAEKGKEIKNIVLRDLHFLNNGSAILLAEEYSEFETKFTTSFTSYEYYDTYYVKTTTTSTATWMNYHCDNIVALRINPEGIIEWTIIITKKQHTAADEGMYSSFATAYVGDKIYLVYNDNPKNLVAAPGEVYGFVKSKNAVVVCAEIDYNGNISKTDLFSAGEAGILTCPQSCRQVSGNMMKIYGEKGKKFKWGVLEFQ
jgi:hypothetical protein